MAGTWYEIVWFLNEFVENAVCAALESIILKMFEEIRIKTMKSIGIMLCAISENTLSSKLLCPESGALASCGGENFMWCEMAKETTRKFITPPPNL